MATNLQHHDGKAHVTYACTSGVSMKGIKQNSKECMHKAFLGRFNLDNRDHNQKAT